MSDLVYWIIAGVGTLGCVYLLYLNDWNIESLLYGIDDEDEVDTPSES